MIIPDQNRQAAFQVDAGWGMPMEVFTVDRSVQQPEQWALIVHKTVGRQTLATGDLEAMCAELGHLCRLTGWRPEREPS